MRRDDPVRKTLVRVALILLVSGFAVALGLAFMPGVPVVVSLAIPAICMLTAVNLFALSNRPRGEHTRRTLEAFRPLKPLGGSKTPSDDRPT